KSDDMSFAVILLCLRKFNKNKQQNVAFLGLFSSLRPVSSVFFSVFFHRLCFPVVDFGFSI
ncbi:hypothetical protein, partial [Prevotella multiformis]|uniref:hypothetical protein n=1 Tax=Prevotella multiformis TaxID=282402 RepID=UPI0023EF99AE